MRWKLPDGLRCHGAVEDIESLDESPHSTLDMGVGLCGFGKGPTLYGSVVDECSDGGNDGGDDGGSDGA